MAGINSRALGGSVDNFRKFNSIEFDSTFGLNEYEAFYRDLDPQIGKWLQIDPEIEKQYGLSPYTAMDDNPVLKSDPLGNVAEVGKEEHKSGVLEKAGNIIMKGVSWINENINPLTPIVETITGKAFNEGKFDIDKPRLQSATEAAISFIPGGKIEGAVIKTGEKALEKTVVKTSVGTEIKGFTKHGVDRAIERGVKPGAIMDAVKNPLKVGEVVTDNAGRQSQRYVGKSAEVVLNPQSGKIITVNPTSSKKVERLIQKQ